MNKQIKFLDLYRQDEPIRGEIDSVIRQVIGDSAFIGGSYVEKFNTAFAEFQRARYCVGVGNGTDALEIILQALGLPEDGEVLVPTNSFIASAEAVTRSGLKVVFCDCDPLTYSIDVIDAAKRVTVNTVAIMPVHMYGHPCDMDAVMSLAKQHELEVVEDCAQAHGAEYRGRKVGTFGIAGAFSFYPGKNLGAYGDGGAIITDDEGFYKRCRMFANHGRSDKYSHLFEGRNSRLDGIQAAILYTKLKLLEKWNKHRSDLAIYYQDELENSGLILPVEMSWAKHVWHLFVVRCEDRDDMRSYLQDRGIECGIHYPVALADLPAYRYLGQYKNEFNASNMAKDLLSLPMGPHLTRDQVLMVSEVVREYLSNK